MKITKKANFKILKAAKGKQIREKTDAYVAKTETTSEHLPYYTDTIYLPLNFDEKTLDDIYVEEKVKE